MTKQELIVLRGLPASGKTTWAEKWVSAQDTWGEKRAVVSRDSIRKAQFGREKTILSYDGEQAVTKIQQGMVDALLSSGYSVVIDDLNLRPKYVREWRRVAQKHGAELDVLEFHLNVEDSIRRDAERRAGGVGAKVIIGLASKYYPKGQFLPVPDEVVEPEPVKYVPDPNLPPAVVVDIDGTVALADGRNPYDLSRVGEDLPNWPVIITVRAMYDHGYDVVFCSGREDSARRDTDDWIIKHMPWASDSFLYMRPSNDKRRDSIVKAELFDTYIAQKHNVVAVFDDRQQVVDMWRAKGLTVFQVAPGDF